MASCVYPYIWANQTIMPNMNFNKVEHRTVIIHMEVITNMYVLPKITMEIITNKRISTYGTEQFPNDFLFSFVFSQGQVTISSCLEQAPNIYPCSFREMLNFSGFLLLNDIRIQGKFSHRMRTMSVAMKYDVNALALSFGASCLPLGSSLNSCCIDW